MANAAIKAAARATAACSATLAGLDVRQIPVPTEPIDLEEIDTSFVALIVEETELDALRELGEEREVRPRSIEGGSERVGFAWPDVHLLH